MFRSAPHGINLSPEAWGLITAEHYDLISLDATMGKKTIPGYHMGLPDDEAMFQKLTISWEAFTVFPSLAMVTVVSL